MNESEKSGEVSHNGSAFDSRCLTSCTSYLF